MLNNLLHIPNILNVYKAFEREASVNGQSPETECDCQRNGIKRIEVCALGYSNIKRTGEEESDKNCNKWEKNQDKVLV